MGLEHGNFIEKSHLVVLHAKFKTICENVNGKKLEWEFLSMTNGNIFNTRFTD